MTFEMNKLGNSSVLVSEMGFGGAPLGGIAQVDPNDRYSLAEQLILPLKPWFKKVNYSGPLQVTAIKNNGKWHAIEYNVRLGVTTAALMLRMLESPLENLTDVVLNKLPSVKWKKNHDYGCTLTLAGQGYPYIVPSIPSLPVDIQTSISCDLWWNEVDKKDQRLCMTSHHQLDMGHRICDVNTFSENLNHAVEKIYQNIKKIRCLGSYYRLDLGQSLWPPGQGF